MNKKYFYEHFPINNDKSKIVLVLSGSDGGINWSRQIAQQFNNYQIATCAIAYWKYKHLPKAISLIPLEIINDIINELKELGYQKIYLYGLSKGAELCLVYSTYFDNIDGVIAVSPPNCIFEGISTSGYTNTSPWTYQNNEIEYIKSSNRKFNLTTMYFKEKGNALRNLFDKTYKEGFNEINRIKIEKAKCPLLFISSNNDSVWNSSMMCDQMMDTLFSNEYPYDNEHISYNVAIHVLCPVSSIKLKVFKYERRHPKRCNNVRRDAFLSTIDWINKFD